MKFSHSFRVSAADIDEQNHVNNVVYLRWIQDVAIAHWRAVTTEEMREKFTWVVVRHEIDYKKPAFENQELSAATWVVMDAKVTATCDRYTEILRGESLLVRARSVWCLIDRETMRPTRIIQELRDIF